MSQQCNLDSLKTALREMTDLEQKMALLYKIGICYDYGSLDSGYYYVQRAVDLSEREGNDKWICRSNSKIGILLARKGKFEEAEQAYQRCEVACKTDFEFSKVYNNKAIYYGMANQPMKARQTLLKTLEIDRRMGNRESEAKVMMNLAMNYESQSDNEKALEYLFEALHINDSLGLEPNLMINYNMISTILSSIKDYENAHKYLDKAIEIGEKLQMVVRLGYSYYSKGKINNDQNKKVEAIQYYEKAIEILEKANDQRALGVVYGSLGKSYIEIGELDKARAIIEQNIERKKAMGDYRNLVLELVNKGRIYIEEKNYSKAYKEAYASLELAKERKILEERLDAYELLALLDSLSGNHQQGVRNLRELIVFKDSIISVEESKKVAELKTRLETEQKEKEIELLSKDNELQALRINQQERNLLIGSGGLLFFLALAIGLFFQRQNLQRTKQQLEASLLEKQTLLKEIHHRVKNNLQLITSLLNLQAEAGEEQSIEDFLYKGQNRVKSMALIHEQLYRSDNISAINMREYMEKLVASIFDSHATDSVQYKIEADNTLLDIDKAIPLGLILNELVNNTLKHAFGKDQNGQLALQLYTKKEKVMLSIADDGKGFDPSLAQQSMGLQLVEILVKQLKGDLNFEQKMGTAISISFPTKLA